ncbi:hypothetical protein M422DRAFT_774724 [Sphaerobolus stellatus SS14]|nr:hypothetical protein M422DRAFT_774724 [Sphaerobolus stellatus SS14]
MPQRQPIRVIIPKLDMSQIASEVQPQQPSWVAAQTPSIASTATRSIQQQAQLRSPTSQRTRSQPLNNGYFSPRQAPSSVQMSEVGRGRVPQVVVSSPSDSPSRSQILSPEPALLPGGGIQVPQGLQFNPTDQGHRLPTSPDLLAGEPDPRNFFRSIVGGLRKIPGVLVRAGRDKSGQERYLEPDAHLEDERDIGAGPSNHSFARSDVETYVSNFPEEDATAIVDSRLQDWNRNRFQRVDGALPESNNGSIRSPARHLHPPQPIPVPGSHTPTPSQAGFSEVPASVLDARLEAEQMRRENEALRQAQEDERARHRYAADLVRSPPSSITSGWSRFTPPRRHHRTPSEPLARLPHRVFSRWTAAQDAEGNRIENPPDETELRNVTSPTTAFGRFFRFLSDMPWVGDRIAADYVPGGVKPRNSADYYNPNPYDHAYGYRNRGARIGSPGPGSDSAFSDPFIPSELRHIDPNIPRIKPGQSWYATDDYDIVTLPAGVPPPPGFEPISYVPPDARPSAPPPDIEAYSSSDHTHVESRVTTPPPRSHVTASGTQYTNFVPSSVVSPTGQSFTFVPGRSRQPLVVPSEFTGVLPLGSVVSGAR